MFELPAADLETKREGMISCVTKTTERYLKQKATCVGNFDVCVPHLSEANFKQTRLPARYFL